MSGGGFLAKFEMEDGWTRVVDVECDVPTFANALAAAVEHVTVVSDAMVDFGFPRMTVAQVEACTMISLRRLP